MQAFVEGLLESPVNLIALLICVASVGGWLAYFSLRPKYLKITVKNLRRAPVRTMLIATATMVLVAKVTLIWTVIYFLDQVTKEKSKDLKLIITERWQLPSQMPNTHADYLNPKHPKFLKELEGLYTPRDFMTWSFYGGTIDPGKFTVESIVFAFCMNPDHIIPMMEDLDNFDPAIVDKLRQNRTGILMGKERMDRINKKVGERFKLTSLNYKDVDLEFEIVGELPEGRYSQSAIMNESYFNESLEKYALQRGGKRHPLDQKRMNLIWLRVPDRDTFNKVGEIIENSPYFADRPVKVETASSGIASFLDAYRDQLNGIKYLLAPAMLIIMSLVVAIAISISVRERKNEIAVMKVLGFKPGTVLLMVLGESMLAGGLSGLYSAFCTWGLVNLVIGGIKFPIAFFPAFQIPLWAFLWGPAMGFASAFLGAFVPAFNAARVQVTEIFSRVA